MKIAVTAQGTELSSEVDMRFGRAKWILLIDTETNEVEAHENTQNLNAASGAGIQTGSRIVNLGAEAVITGNVGPNAFKTLNAGRVGIMLCKGETVGDAVELFKAGKLEPADQANVEGHWV